MMTTTTMIVMIMMVVVVMTATVIVVVVVMMITRKMAAKEALAKQKRQHWGREALWSKARTGTQWQTNFHKTSYQWG